MFDRLGQTDEVMDSSPSPTVTVTGLDSVKLKSSNTKVSSYCRSKPSGIICLQVSKYCLLTLWSSILSTLVFIVDSLSKNSSSSTVNFKVKKKLTIKKYIFVYT